MATLSAFPQPAPSYKSPTYCEPVQPLQLRRKLSQKRKAAGSRSESRSESRTESRCNSPTKVSSSANTSPKLHNSASVPSLRDATCMQPLGYKLTGLAGARAKAKDVWARRKGSGSDLDTLKTVEEVHLDSPTVPGRPVLHHKRSESSGWRQCAFGAAMVSSVTPPPRLEDLSLLSPFEGKDAARAISPLALNTPAVTPKNEDLPPMVPPKTPPRQKEEKSFFYDRSPSIMDIPVSQFATSPKRERTKPTPGRPESPTLRCETRIVRHASPIMKEKAAIPKSARPPSPIKVKQATTPATARPESPTLMSSPQIFARRPQSPVTVVNVKEKQVTAAASKLRTITVPERQFQDPRKCPPRVPVPSSRQRAESEPVPPISEKETQKPKLRVNTSTSPREKSARAHHRKQSSTSTNLNLPLPSGVRPSHVRTKLTPHDIVGLQMESRTQSQKFDVLRPKDVDILTKELVQLESRCHYLRMQHQSVRAERKAIHTRMLTYLRTARVFSQENLLKQEEALAALDEAIEGWEAKVEKAEERRNRVRQKLLEHMCASLAIPEVSIGPIDRSFTPPATPEKEMDQHPEPEHEVITVYALLADVEHEIGRMGFSPSA